MAQLSLLFVRCSLDTVQDCVIRAVKKWSRLQSAVLRTLLQAVGSFPTWEKGSTASAVQNQNDGYLPTSMPGLYHSRGTGTPVTKYGKG